MKKSEIYKQILITYRNKIFSKRKDSSFIESVLPEIKKLGIGNEDKNEIEQITMDFFEQIRTSKNVEISELYKKTLEIIKE